MPIKLVEFTIPFTFKNVLDNIRTLNRVTDNLESKGCSFVGSKIDCYYKQNEIVSKAGDRETEFSFLTSLQSCKEPQKTISEIRNIEEIKNVEVIDAEVLYTVATKDNIDPAPGRISYSDDLEDNLFKTFQEAGYRLIDKIRINQKWDADYCVCKIITVSKQKYKLKPWEYETVVNIKDKEYYLVHKEICFTGYKEK